MRDEQRKDVKVTARRIVRFSESEVPSARYFVSRA